MHGLVAKPPVHLRGEHLQEIASRSQNTSREDQECLGNFMLGISRSLSADSLIAASHHEIGPPIILFSDGAAKHDPDVGQVLLRSAVRMIEQPITKPGTVSISDHGPGGYVFTAALPVHGLVITLTSLLRDHGAGSSSVGRNRLAGLLPIMAPFFSMWSERKGKEYRLVGLEAALNNSYGSTLLLDRTGNLLFANNSAREFLHAGRGLAINRGRLTASKLTETLRLAATIEHLCASSSGDKATIPVLAIRRAHMRPLMVALALADARENEEPTIVVRLFDPEQDASDLIEPACRYYGLSLSETRLTRHITEGLALATAAAAMGVREQTARSYLKQVFLKTETNRQAELVAVMLHSAVRLAPHSRPQIF